MEQMHIYGQEDWHDDVYIVGSVESLTALKMAIEYALAHGSSFVESVMTADGEGYGIKVAVASEAEMDKVSLPYKSEIAMDHRGAEHHPSKVVKSLQNA